MSLLQRVNMSIVNNENIFFLEYVLIFTNTGVTKSIWTTLEQSLQIRAKKFCRGNKMKDFVLQDGAVVVA